MSEIVLAKSAGFCFGVNRAVDRAFALASSGADAVTLGAIIHNPQVVERLARMGLPPIDSPEEAAPGQTVLIRSHGVSKKFTICFPGTRSSTAPARLLPKSTALWRKNRRLDGQS